MNCPIFPPLPQCGGHGICNTLNGLCECDNGWTSRGDFFMSKGVNCNVNLTAIKIKMLKTITLLKVTRIGYTVMGKKLDLII